MYRLMFMGIFLSLGGCEENLILILIQGFGKICNLSSITACLPIPNSERECIPWGIIPINLSMIQYDNLTNVRQRNLVSKETLQSHRKGIPDFK